MWTTESVSRNDHAMRNGMVFWPDANLWFTGHYLNEF